MSFKEGAKYWIIESFPCAPISRKPLEPMAIFFPWNNCQNCSLHCLIFQKKIIFFFVHFTEYTTCIILLNTLLVSYSKTDGGSDQNQTWILLNVWETMKKVVKLDNNTNILTIKEIVTSSTYRGGSRDFEKGWRSISATMVDRRRKF